MQKANEPIWFNVDKEEAPNNDTYQTIKTNKVEDKVTEINVGVSPYKVMVCTPCRSDVSMHYCQAVLKFQQACWKKGILCSFTLLKSSLESDLQSNLLPMIESKSNGSAQSVFTPPESSQGSNITLLPMPVGDTQPQPINANDPVIAPVRPPEVTTTPVASTMSSVSFVNMISNKQLSIG